MLTPNNSISFPENQITPEEAKTIIPDANAPEAFKFLYPVYQAQSGLVYPERLKPKQEHEHLDTTNTAVEVFQKDVDDLPPEDFTLIRHAGFGGSDAGVLTGVNPFTTLEELIKQKASKTVLPEEIITGPGLISITKGNDLEPLIIHKFSKLLEMRIIKPSDMFKFKDFEYLFMNFDGVAGTAQQYIPFEIKVVTKKGERHYNPTTPIYDSITGWGRIPANVTTQNISIETKAAMYGIPPYYYTQLQDEMMALNAPFGYLGSLWENTWTLRLYFVHRDEATQNAIKIQGFKAWEKVLMLRERNGWNEQQN